MLDSIEYWRDAPVWTPNAISEATKGWFKYLGRLGGRDRVETNGVLE